MKYRITMYVESDKDSANLKHSVSTLMQRNGADLISVRAELVTGASVEQLSDEDLWPFGKYKGAKACTVPDDYLVWCLNQEWFHEDGWARVKQYAEERVA